MFHFSIHVVLNVSKCATEVPFSVTLTVKMADFSFPSKV